VVEASFHKGQPKVHKVTCAVDCGLVLHPDGVRQQIEGAVVFALTAALNGRIDIRQGQVQQGNFADYPLLPLSNSPSVEVILLPSANPPSGVGEIGVPPLAPALANALYALTGKRLRNLPLREALL
jgi:isoquinoline 1-oxidoreductase beta subunit